MADVVIVGGGGFGREIYDWVADCIQAGEPWRVRGFIDDDPDCLEGFDVDAPVLCSVGEYEPGKDDLLVLAIGSVDAKKKVSAALTDRGGTFLTLIHPTAIVSPSARLGQGVVVCPLATISSHARVADFVTINCYCFVAHDAKVGEFGVLSPYATINGFVSLGREVFMGTHATVILSTEVGARARISANSVAMSKVKPNSLIQGVPGKSWMIFADPDDGP